VATAAKIANQDWQNDCLGKSTMSYRLFLQCWFQAADIWSSGVEVSEYLEFLARVLACVRADSAKPDPAAHAGAAALSISTTDLSGAPGICTPAGKRRRRSSALPSPHAASPNFKPCAKRATIRTRELWHPRPSQVRKKFSEQLTDVKQGSLPDVLEEVSEGTCSRFAVSPV
jgi:hypothetical protein